MWFLPLLVVGAIAVAVASRSKRELAPPSRQLPPAEPPRIAGSVRGAGPSGPPGVPGPISVLGEILRGGQAPPPTVILCAIAEAQAIGRPDLASDIVKVFVAPVVYHHQRLRARRARPSCERGSYDRGSCEISCSPRRDADMAYNVSPPPSPFQCTPGATWSAPPPVAPRAEASAATPPAATDALAQPPTPTIPTIPMASMDDEINALLHADPARFMELVSRSGTFPTQASQIQPPTPQPSPATTTAPIVTPTPVAPVEQPTGLPPETVAQMQEDAGLAEAADRTRAMARAMAPGSPIPGVPDGAWRNFVVLLARESPQFSSSRHVGQYRQRRERLAELGINPASIADSPEAQRSALDADLANAHQHAVDGELFAQHLGRPVILPGVEGALTITLSGVLGVIQCAGLEGAAGWLERANDRKRYPHTTQAFLHTNGVF